MLQEKISTVLSFLNEKQKRLYLASEANYIGHGGVLEIARASNVSRKTIIKGKNELAQLNQLEADGVLEDLLPAGRMRKQGGGRKNLKQTDASLLPTLEQMLEPVTRGHPESVLKWTCLSTRSLAAALKKKRTLCKPC